MSATTLKRLPEWEAGASGVISIQSVRVTTGSVTASSQLEVTVTWPQAFPSTSYTVSATVEESTAATDTLKVLKVVSRSTTDCVVRVQNVNASARTGTLHLIGISD